MTDKPLVSVVIATYNMARYLPQALRSALDQTYSNLEVLVIDDGSQDDTPQVMLDFQDDSRVRYMVQQNLGQAAAKNYGIRESKGEYIAFLDADDVWALEKLDIQMPLFAQSETVGLVYSAFVCIDERGVRLPKTSGRLFRGWVSGPLLISNFVGFSSSVVRRECFKQLGTFNEQLGMGIDYDLWLRISTRFEFDYVDRPLCCYREWSGQMSRNWNTRYLKAIEIMKRFLREFPDVVDKRTVNEAWAHTYAGFGYHMRNKGNMRGEALKMYLRALSHKPGYSAAWKGIAATVLGR
jgi:glycosyltransferase involved in cell wall biosynthesis